MMKLVYQGTNSVIGSFAILEDDNGLLYESGLVDVHLIVPGMGSVFALPCLDNDMTNAGVPRETIDRILTQYGF